MRFTDTQLKLTQKILDISNIRTKSALFSTTAEFMRTGFNHIDYVDFITGIGVKSSGYSINKNRTYEFFYELYEDYRMNWVNIRVRGVIILFLLHYEKIN